MNQNDALSKLEKEFKAGDDKEYEIKDIINSAMYDKEVTNKQMPDFYYLVLWKSYPESQNIYEPSTAVIHLQKLINIFYKSIQKN